MTVQCACCEKSVEETDSVRLLHKADVTICFDCLSWLNTQHDRHVRALFVQAQDRGQDQIVRQHALLAGAACFDVLRLEV